MQTIGIRGNESADRAAKEALEKEHKDDLIPFSGLTPPQWGNADAEVKDPSVVNPEVKDSSL